MMLVVTIIGMFAAIAISSKPQVDSKTPEGVQTLKSRCVTRGLQYSIKQNDFGYNVVVCKDSDGGSYNARDLSDF